MSVHHADPAASASLSKQRFRRAVECESARERRRPLCFANFTRSYLSNSIFLIALKEPSDEKKVLSSRELEGHGHTRTLARRLAHTQSGAKHT